YVYIVVADVVILLVLLGHLQVVLSLVMLRLGLLDIALADETVDLISLIGGSNAHEGGKLVDGGGHKGLDCLHSEGTDSGQAGLPVLEPLEDLLIKVKFKFRIHYLKFLFQHTRASAFLILFLL